MSKCNFSGCTNSALYCRNHIEKEKTKAIESARKEGAKNEIKEMFSQFEMGNLTTIPSKKNLTVNGITEEGFRNYIKKRLKELKE